MASALDLVKSLSTAWEKKDEAAMRQLLHADYHFKGPMMEMKTEEVISFMQNSPFVCSTENSDYISEGNKVVHVFDWKITAPVQATIPMVEVLEVEADKIKKARLFFDTALFPEALKMMMAGECPEK